MWGKICEAFGGIIILLSFVYNIFNWGNDWEVL